MSLGEHAESKLGEVTDPNKRQPPAAVDDGSLTNEGKQKGAARKKPDPNKPDPEEVQYPGYFKDGGSL